MLMTIGKSECDSWINILCGGLCSSHSDLTFARYHKDSVLLGSSFVTDDNFYDIRFGCKELDLDIIDMRDVVACIVSICHEFRHYQQYVGCKSGIDIDDAVVVNRLACEYNPQYYQNSYNHNLREFDAERYGVVYAYDFIENITSKDTAFDLVLEYVSKKNKISDIYKDIDLNSIASVNDIFDYLTKRYNECKSEKFVYKPEHAKKDVAGAYFCRHNIFDGSGITFADFCRNGITGFERDCIVAKINLIKHPELFDLYGKNDIIKKLRSEIRDLPEIEDDVSYENELKYND